MITLFTGAPGAGKTAALVDLLSKLVGDRPLFVHGLEGLTLPHTVVDARKWPEELPDGAILVIDEAQHVWRPRGPGSKVPPEVEALETHRHRGIDIYLTTQAPRLVDANVRNLVGRHVHIRDTGFLGRWWYEWPEVSESMTWKTCVNKHKYKLPKKAFALYTSASIHTKPVRGTPVLVYVVLLSLLAAAAGAFLVWRIVQRGMNGGESPKPVPQVTTSVQPASVAGAPAVRLIDERVDWIPRVSHKPETAPAYDHLRVVVAMPLVSSAICVDDRCQCFTQQGTEVPMSNVQCLAWAQHRPFNPYAAAETASADTQHRANPARGSPSAVETAASSSPLFGVLSAQR